MTYLSQSAAKIGHWNGMISFTNRLLKIENKYKVLSRILYIIWCTLPGCKMEEIKLFLGIVISMGEYDNYTLVLMTKLLLHLE